MLVEVPPRARAELFVGTVSVRYKNASVQLVRLTLIFKNSSSILGFKLCKFTLLGGMIPFSSARTVLMTPATPLAPSRCPILDFTDPLHILLAWVETRSYHTHMYNGLSRE